MTALERIRMFFSKQAPAKQRLRDAETQVDELRIKIQDARARLLAETLERIQDDR